MSYGNIRWSPDKRREISWNEISDIDYLLGPLLRKGDFRSQVSIQTPPSRYSQQNERDKFWEFFKGDFNDDWGISIEISYGIANNLELGYRRTYTPSTHYLQYRYWTSDVSTANTFAKYQPLKWLRIRADFGGESIREKSVSNNGLVFNYYNWSTWNANVSLDCVF